jgi:hypothetical protein
VFDWLREHLGITPKVLAERYGMTLSAVNRHRTLGGKQDRMMPAWMMLDLWALDRLGTPLRWTPSFDEMFLGIERPTPLQPATEWLVRHGGARTRRIRGRTETAARTAPAGGDAAGESRPEA